MGDSATPSVAVVVPTFDRARVLGRALESVARQEEPPAEVVVVDDGSGDDTLAVIDAWTEELPLRYLYQENAGPSAARNVGVALCRSRWVCFLDSDDEWAPEKLTRQLEASRRRPEIAVWHTDEIWIRRGNQVLQRERHRKRGGHIYRDCLPLCVISPSAVMLDRETFLAAGGFDESLPVCEDYDLWLRLCCEHEVGFVDEPLVRKHGGHADQLSRRLPAMDRFRVLALEKSLASGKLGQGDWEATRAMVLEKLEILRAGALKRGLTAAAEGYEEKLACWRAAEGPDPGGRGTP